MTDQQYVIELEGDQRAIVDTDEGNWLNEKLREEPGATRFRLRFDDLDTEGHVASSRIRVIADGDDDTEGHALSLHFPSVEEADRFRKRLLLTGVLAGTVALGAAGGIGLANMTSDQAATGAAAAGTAGGSAWTQDERQIAPAMADSAGGSAWTQDERQIAPAAGVDAHSSDDVGVSSGRGGVHPK